MNSYCNESNNVYDIRFREGLYFTVPKYYLVNSSDHKISDSVCIIIYLYYPDSLCRFHDYIINAIDTCDLCIITSNNELYKKVINEFSEYSKVQVRLKQNRGRDVAALLVSAKDIFDKYKYICFVHDKKEKASVWKERTDAWIKNLWECTLGSAEYIKNIVYLFNLHKDIGMMVPPEMIDFFNTFWYADNWYDDFTLTCKLAKDIGLKTNLDYNKPPIALGTVFWCRSAALKKLWNINWTYESFDKEPLPGDGTISHAVERIFPYVAQDAGFKTATVMTEEENARILSFTQLGMHSFYKILSEELGVEHIDDALKYHTRAAELKEYYKKHNEIFIYGNGIIGNKYFKLLRHLNIPVAGFIVSDKKDNTNENGLSVYSISEISKHIINENCGIVIGVSVLYSSEIINILQSYNINDYLVL